MRAVKSIALVLIVALAAAGGFWAGRTTLRPVALPSDVATSAVVVTVSDQTVGRSYTFNVTVTQQRRPLATNALTGVVTQVSQPSSVKVGDVLYTVGDVPVRVVTGAIPFHRALAEGAVGADVKQLRDALVVLGYQPESGDTFRASTTAAVKVWQKKLGAPQTGIVALGELVAVPTLPLAVSLDTTVLQLGAVLAGGEKVVLAPAGIPVFDLMLTPEQAALVPSTATIDITWKQKKWTAVLGETENNSNGQTVFHLTAPDGSPVCGTDCSLVATGGAELYLPAQVRVVPPATGPAVPVAAITTDASGAAWVTVVGARDEKRRVTVKGSQDGVAVVEGVKSGEKVRVFGSSASGGQLPQPSGGSSQPSDASSATPKK